MARNAWCYDDYDCIIICLNTNDTVLRLLLSSVSLLDLHMRVAKSLRLVKSQTWWQQMLKHFRYRKSPFTLLGSLSKHYSDSVNLLCVASLSATSFFMVGSISHHSLSCSLISAIRFCFTCGFTNSSSHVPYTGKNFVSCCKLILAF